MPELKIIATAAAWDHFKSARDDYEHLAKCAVSFRYFLNFWHFRDQDTKQIRVLGEGLWPGQETFIREIRRAAWMFALKARQLGYTTIECAFDAWVARFRDPFARVHMFSKAESEAVELLDRVKFGYYRLPEWMQLPVTSETTTEFEIAAGPDDRRFMKAYPAGQNPSRSATCTHAHIDEWAFVTNPEQLMAAVEPSAAGSLHILTTSAGPTSYTSEFYRRCESGDARDRKTNPINAVFIPADARPDRTPAWLTAKKAGTSRQLFLREYPMTVEDALAGGGDFVFETADVDLMARYALPVVERGAAGRRYVIGVDIGQSDATVITVLDVTTDGTDSTVDVAFYRRERGFSYPQIQAAIEDAWARFNVGGSHPILAIEANSMGLAVIENLKIPDGAIHKFMTTKPSKAAIIEGLSVAVQGQLVKADPAACEQMLRELRAYQIPDDAVVQDSVMSLAIAWHHIDAQSQGRLVRIASW